MAKKYTGSLTLEWFNKNRSIITQEAQQKREGDIPAPRINWINKDEALFYEISEEEGKGLTPYWVDRNDIRVKESRPLVFRKAFKAVSKGKGFKVVESDEDDPGIENMLIKGDNLLALNTLKKMFDQKPDDEKVKCIFIDPPYNTGSAFEQYDDSLAHSEWLTLIRDRLIIMRNILRNDGSIWISIDENESHYLKVLCDEVFGRENFVCNIVWQKRTSPDMRATLGDGHDSILVFVKNFDIFKPTLKKLPQSSEQRSMFKNPDNDPRGVWVSSDFTAQGFRPNQMYTIITPDGTQYKPPEGRCWKNIESVYYDLLKDNRMWFGKNGGNMPRRKTFLSESDGIAAWSWWPNSEVGHNQEAKKEVITLFGASNAFETPKPERLLDRILFLGSDENDIILDAFLGSGTTISVAQKMNRRWIGIELGDHCDTHCIPRLKKVLSGEDQGGISQSVSWQGGGSFKYYHLGESIISIDKEGFGDFNWSLGRDFLEKSLLATYDFILDESLKLPGSTAEEPPKVGFYDVNNISLAGIVSLAPPDEKDIPLDNDFITALIKAIRKHKSPRSITIFTNRGVEMAWEAKPEDVEIIKVPHAIFAELER